MKGLMTFLLLLLCLLAPSKAQASYDRILGLWASSSGSYIKTIRNEAEDFYIYIYEQGVVVDIVIAQVDQAEANGSFRFHYTTEAGHHIAGRYDGADDTVTLNNPSSGWKAT